jgi:tetratricopeptide (TPR) repeat protein
MSALCEKLYPFIDGELTSEESERVRGHLAVCDVCASGFQEALQLEVLAAEAYEEQPAAVASARPRAPAAREEELPRRAKPRARKRRQAKWGLAAVAGLAAVVYVSLPAAGPSEQLWLTQAPTRRVEARLSLDVLDEHRPFMPMRSDKSAAVEPVPLRELSRLDERKDAVAIAAAFLVRGDVEQARGFLETASASPDRDNDLAVVAMQRGELHEALRLLERVLEQEPRHEQARWNRALVLRDLGQKELAARAFEQLAAQGERGWSEEAARNARSLREQLAP